MTKTPSVEERVEEFTETLKGEFPCQMFGGVPHYDILLLTEELKASFTADRTALLTELRETIQAIDFYGWNEQTQSKIKEKVQAHLDERINPSV